MNVVAVVLVLGPDIIHVSSPRLAHGGHPIVGRVVVHFELHHAAVRWDYPDLQGRLRREGGAKKGEIGGKVLSAAASARSV